MIVAVAYQAEQGDNGDIRVCVVQNFFCLVADEDACLYAQLRVIADIHAHDLRVDVNGAYDLCPFFIEVT